MPEEYSGGFTIIVVYRHPGMCMELFKNTMQRKLRNINLSRLMVYGDFNSNLQETLNLKRFMENEFQLQLLSNIEECTTDMHTTLDACFVAPYFMDKMRCHVYEHLFSYHKPIVTQLDVD